MERWAAASAPPLSPDTRAWRDSRYRSDYVEVVQRIYQRTFSNVVIASLILFRLQEDIFFFSSEGLGVAYAAIKKFCKMFITNVARKSLFYPCVAT